ncbi:MAG: hypothetical protein IPM23_23905 [Candidatus Melainabacteria bacterium]|nr:hypothetical protein [Candidatus Melainabacteria bacterium]
MSANLPVLYAFFALLLAGTLRLEASAGEKSKAGSGGYWMSPPLSGYGHCDKRNGDKFVNPLVTTELQSSLADVVARLVLATPAFAVDGCLPPPPPSAAEFTVLRGGRPLLKKKFKGFSSLAGPTLTANREQPPTVTLDLVSPPEEFRNYDFEIASGRYKLNDGEKRPEADEKTDTPCIRARRALSAGDLEVEATWSASPGNLDSGGRDFELVVKKDNQVMFADKLDKDLPLRDGEKQAADYSVVLSGPVIVSLTGDSRKQVVARLSVPVVRDGNNDQRHFEIIIFESESGVFKRVTRSWLSFPPHLADLELDGKLEFVTQDGGLADALWHKQGSALKTGSGGPIQIWRFDGEALVDVTRQMPGEIERHAAASLKQFESEPDHPECYLLGYTGDLMLLGRVEEALRELSRLETEPVKKEKPAITEQLKKFGYL